jgi:hypothetical protein
MAQSLKQSFDRLYQMDAMQRTLVVWLAFQLILWLTFGIGYLLNQDAWIDVPAVPPSSAAEGGWLGTLLYIVISNSIVLALIVGGNLFVRFGPVTPGMLVLLVQAVSIGWLAGTNGFEVPFTSVALANAQFLRVGLWETTAYAVGCALTLPKSLLIADGLFAREWTEQRKLKDLRFSSSEKGLALVIALTLIGAALVETIYLTCST